MEKPSKEELKQRLSDIEYAVTQEMQRNVLFQENTMISIKSEFTLILSAGNRSLAQRINMMLDVVGRHLLTP